MSQLTIYVADCQTVPVASLASAKVNKCIRGPMESQKAGNMASPV